MPDHQVTGARSTRPIGVVALILGSTLMLCFVAAALWVVDKIDSRDLAEEKQNIAAALDARQQRIAREQDTSAAWDDAVINLRSDDQFWIAENLVDWMSDFFGHDRVYVTASDGTIIRAASAGEGAPSVFNAADLPVVETMTQSLRDEMAIAAQGLNDSTSVVSGMGKTDIARLADGTIALISIRPIVPTSSAVAQTPGSEFLHTSIVLLQPELLSTIGQQIGISDLNVGGPQKGRGALSLRTQGGQTIGFLVWTPRKPAWALMNEIAPAAGLVLSLCIVSSLVLLIWLRRTTQQLAHSQAQIEFLAFHDPLTGAANRALFEVRLKDALEYEYLAAAKVALIVIDLDKFKEINDTLGHMAGDQLIKQAAKRLTGVLVEEATLTRLGGDEFAVVQPGVVSEGHARFLCQTVLDAFHDPFLIAGETVAVTASIGLALESGMATSVAEMVRRADLALYAAKAAGRNCFCIYDAAMDQSRREKRILEVDLRNALLTGEGLELHYQPIFDTHTMSLLGAEALVRWSHPTRGSLPPDVFIGIAEERGVICDLGLWVLTEACRFASAAKLPWVAVNVSPLQFRDPGFADQVFRVLDQQGLEPHRLELEITEGLLLENSMAVRQSLVKLRAGGVRIALDDFGTGYSSISYLSHYQLDKLKIDQSIIRQLGEGTTTLAIVRSIIEMARALDMAVTAEGVEEQYQLQALRTLGCSSLQGYLLSRPISEDRLLAMLSNTKSKKLVNFG